MQGGEKLSLEQIRALLEASQEIRFAGHSRKEVYEWVGRTLREHNYAKQGREAKGLVRAYIGKMTGLRRAQVTRLLTNHERHEEMRDWIGDDFDPEAFSVDKVNGLLTLLHGRR